MHIDSYQFGRIVIDGERYTKDLIILGDSVRGDWRRQQGHLLSADDVQPVIDAAPSVLVVGCGAYGMMKIAEEALQLLQGHDIRLEASDTFRAVQTFNELSRQGVNVAAALHLTC
ncbi:MAG TPA: Mth938-like domain-containing protein [Sedimentisphaerales bacterium]|nr:Mth938-like domain-containing protein [Sedimentisphaerales bacterium]